VPKRDPKGLYKKVEKGEIKNFTGISDTYEEPEAPDILVETKESVDECIGCANCALFYSSGKRSSI